MTLLPVMLSTCCCYAPHFRSISFSKMQKGAENRVTVPQQNEIPDNELREYQRPGMEELIAT